MPEGGQLLNGPGERLLGLRASAIRGDGGRALQAVSDVTAWVLAASQEIASFRNATSP